MKRWMTCVAVAFGLAALLGMMLPVWGPAAWANSVNSEVVMTQDTEPGAAGPAVEASSAGAETGGGPVVMLLVIMVTGLFAVLAVFPMWAGEHAQGASSLLSD